MSALQMSWEGSVAVLARVKLKYPVLPLLPFRDRSDTGLRVGEGQLIQFPGGTNGRLGDGDGENRAVSCRCDSHGAQERDLLIEGGLGVDLSHIVTF